jgi:5-methylcytosine-specific restriction endonuclease McrA
VTPSHDAAQELGEQLPEAVVRERTETTREAAARVPEDGILIAAGAWAGLDTPIQWASIVIPRVPFERPTVLDEKIESRYIDSRNTANRRMRQVIGRGLRRPDAQCAIYILDQRHAKIGAFVPERFTNSWLEGGIAIARLIEAERIRSKAIRKRALQYHGCQCHGCDLVPAHPSQIDIHHLKPIADGERQTTLDDVIPLCANCHRLAHTCNPPLPIDELRDMVTKNKDRPDQPT